MDTQSEKAMRQSMEDASAHSGSEQETIPQDHLAAFSDKIAALLIDEAIIILRTSGTDGIGLASHLLLDAQKYKQIYPCARGCDERLFKLEKKVNDWNTRFYGNRQLA